MYIIGEFIHVDCVFFTSILVCLLLLVSLQTLLVVAFPIGLRGPIARCRGSSTIMLGTVLSCWSVVVARVYRRICRRASNKNIAGKGIEMLSKLDR